MSKHIYSVLPVFLPVPIGTAWSLLVSPPARRLWQPGVNGAELLKGEEGQTGCEYALSCDSPLMPSLVIERVIRNEGSVALQTIKYLPNLDCYSDYRISPHSAHLCQLQLKRQLLTPSSTKPANPHYEALIPHLSPQAEMAALKETIETLIARASKAS